jgi:hypothetical protein
MATKNKEQQKTLSDEFFKQVLRQETRRVLKKVPRGTKATSAAEQAAEKR